MLNGDTTAALALRLVLTRREIGFGSNEGEDVRCGVPVCGW